MIHIVLFWLIAAAIFLLSLALTLFLLMLGLKKVNARDVTFQRTAALLVIVMAGCVLLIKTTDAITGPNSAGLWLPGLVRVLGCLAFSVVTCSVMFGLSFRRSVNALMLPFAAVLPVCVVIVLVDTFAFAVLQTDSRAMAPTILGRHLVTQCPRCGASAFTYEHEGLAASDDPKEAICMNMHTFRPDPDGHDRSIGDMVVAARYLFPKRWDLIIFDSPEPSGVQSVRRVIGLPGEEVIIRNGDIFIDGLQMKVPEAIRNIALRVDHHEEFFGARWGSEQRPARLGDDEYFVLADNAEFASDSRRWWIEGGVIAEYAVSTDEIRGVIIHTCWPPGRFRSHIGQ